MRYWAFFNLIFLPVVIHASKIINPACVSQLAKFATFSSGESTHQRNTSKNFFEKGHADDGSPRIVFMIGPPGAGKSTWISKIDLSIWNLLSPDRVRSEILRQMKQAGQLLDGMVADEKSSSHHFHPEVLRLSEKKIEQIFDGFLKERRPIVVDGINGNLKRVLRIIKARKLGYFVEGLYFFNSDPEVFVSNASQRSSGDNAYLQPEIVRHRHRAISFFNSEIKVDPHYRTPTYPDVQLGNVAELYHLHETHASLSEAVKIMEPDRRNLYAQLIHEDVFNRLEIIKTVPADDRGLLEWLSFVDQHAHEFTIQYPPRREYFRENFLVPPVEIEIDRDDPLLIYVHVPFCEKKCYYCNFAVDTRSNLNIFSLYTSALIKEIERHRSRLDASQVIGGIDIGGGTPTRLPIEDLERLLKALDPFRKASKHPFPLSIETTPSIASSEKDKLRLLIDNGVDRVSMGIQSFNEELLAKVNRSIHRDKNQMAAANVHDLKFKRFNVDLIFGLPGQTEADWLEDLKRVVDLDPDSITTYDCLYRGKGRALTKMNACGIPSRETYGKLYDLAYDFLISHGFHALYGSVNFSKRANETGTSAYFESRLLDGQNYIGFGNYSSSWIRDYWYFNVFKVNDYMDRIRNGESVIGDFYRLPKSELYAKYILYSLNYGIIDTERFRKRFRADFDQIFDAELRKAKSEGWLVKDGSLWKTSRSSFQSLNHVRALFYSQPARAWLRNLNGD